VACEEGRQSCRIADGRRHGRSHRAVSCSRAPFRGTRHHVLTGSHVHHLPPNWWRVRRRSARCDDADRHRGCGDSSDCRLAHRGGCMGRTCCPAEVVAASHWSASGTVGSRDHRSDGGTSHQFLGRMPRLGHEQRYAVDPAKQNPMTAVADEARPAPPSSSQREMAFSYAFSMSSVRCLPSAARNYGTVSAP